LTEKAALFTGKKVKVNSMLCHYFRAFPWHMKIIFLTAKSNGFDFHELALGWVAPPKNQNSWVTATVMEVSMTFK